MATYLRVFATKQEATVDMEDFVRSRPSEVKALNYNTMVVQMWSNDDEYHWAYARTTADGYKFRGTRWDVIAIDEAIQDDALVDLINSRKEL